MSAIFALLLSVIALYFIARLAWLHYALESRVKALENRKEQPVKTGHVPDWQKPVDNFSPAKPETLRPKEVKGREAGDNVYEFDIKVKA